MRNRQYSKQKVVLLCSPSTDGMYGDRVLSHLGFWKKLVRFNSSSSNIFAPSPNCSPMFNALSFNHSPMEKSEIANKYTEFVVN